MRVGADEAEREVEVAEDLRRVDRDVALGVDGGAEVLQAEGGAGGVLRARGQRREQDEREGEGEGAAARCMQQGRRGGADSFTRRVLLDGALELLERVVLDLRGRRGLGRGRRVRGCGRRRFRRRLRRLARRRMLRRRRVRARACGCVARRMRRDCIARGSTLRATRRDGTRQRDGVGARGAAGRRRVAATYGVPGPRSDSSTREPAGTTTSRASPPGDATATARRAPRAAPAPPRRR